MAQKTKGKGILRTRWGGSVKGYLWRIYLCMKEAVEMEKQKTSLMVREGIGTTHIIPWGFRTRLRIYSPLQQSRLVPAKALGKESQVQKQQNQRRVSKVCPCRVSSSGPFARFTPACIYRPSLMLLFLYLTISHRSLMLSIVCSAT